MKTNYKLNNKFADFSNFLNNIQQYFIENKQSIHKARNELKIINYQDIDTIVKSFKVPSTISKIIYTFFRSSKAKRSYDYSLKINHFCPEPIGYIEFYKNGLIDKSYFISVKFDYDFTIREALHKSLPNTSEEEYLHIYKAFAKFSCQLHDNNIFHHDYSPGNILIKKVKQDYDFKIVDINRMTFKVINAEMRARSFSKLWAHEGILKVIAEEYLKYYPQADEGFIKNVLNFSQKIKKIKTLKKKILMRK
ncbi:MAG: hypothetical protein HQL46_06115 [Gammaproteobacteria bacterium]|nr:hypothetical protein [Gammaproteobacteria bacterium]